MLVSRVVTRTTPLPFRCSGRENSLENGHIHKEGGDLYETQFVKNAMCINLAENCAEIEEVRTEWKGHVATPLCRWNLSSRGSDQAETLIPAALRRHRPFRSLSGQSPRKTKRHRSHLFGVKHFVWGPIPRISWLNTSLGVIWS
jgi:hypothetical protein